MSTFKKLTNLDGLATYLRTYMTISILGCGWYGLALAKALIADGVQVNASTTSAEKLAVLKTEGIKPFLIDLSQGQSAPDPGFFDCDVLVIAIPPKARSGQGAEYLPKLEQAVSAIRRSLVKKVILISSTGVYADMNKEVNELTDPQPDTLSGKLLLEAEELFKAEAAFQATILRFGGLIGPGRDPGRFFAGKKNIPNGLAPVNLIHLDDCIGITKAIIAKDVFGYTINACSPHHPPKEKFYTNAAAVAGLELPEFLPELEEWKIVNSVIIGDKLSYQYQAVWGEHLK